MPAALLAGAAATGFAQGTPPSIDSPDFFAELQTYLGNSPAPAEGLRREAKSGDLLAQARLCAVATDRRLVALRVPAAEGIPYCKSLAEREIPPGMTLYGMAHLEGAGVPQNAAEGVRWLRRGAEKGSLLAMAMLGDLYVTGQSVRQSDTEAFKWYRMAAERGAGTAMEVMGEMHSTGRGVAKSDAEAVKWYRMAAEKGRPRPAFLVASSYLIGRGVAKDDAAAAKWLLVAAQNGHLLAMVIMGTNYANGRGVVKNDAEAVTWLRRAVEKNAPQAFLVPLLAPGGGDAADKDAPVAKYYQSMAAGGDLWAMFVVGVMHENGLLRVPKDGAQALAWYLKAAERGNELAAERVAALRR